MRIILCLAVVALVAGVAPCAPAALQTPVARAANAKPAIVEPPTVKSPLELIHEEEADHPEKALQDYSDFIIAHSPQLLAGETEEVAVAFFNRGILFTRLQRTAEAKRSYMALEDGFATSTVRLVKLQVAKGLVNLAFLSLQDGQYKDTIAYAQKVDARYSGAHDGHLGEDGFDLQVVKALNDKADAYNRLGVHQAAVATCDAILARFRAAQGEKMRLALDFTRNLRKTFGASIRFRGVAPLGR